MSKEILSLNLTDLAGKMVAITGKVAVTRKEAAELLRLAGANFCSSVTPATEILILGKLPESHALSNKYLRAVQFGAMIIPAEAVFQNVLKR